MRVSVLSYFITEFAAYLLGAMPTGYLVGRAKGVDIRTVGSKNMGATNVFRTVGKALGIFVLLVDALKGYAACALIAPLVFNWLAPHYSGLVAAFQNEPVEFQLRLKVIAGVGAILGHNYTCWLNFKGGKGIATTAGVMGALVPWALLIVVIVFAVLFAATRYVSAGSIAGAAALPFATWFTTQNIGLTIITGALGALAIVKHKKNIQRLMAGTENRIEFKTKEAAK